MFIPVSLATGVTTVDSTANVSGVLNAACEVVYKGKSYAANTDIPVAKGDTITLRTTITADADIVVKLAGRSYYWRVRLPIGLRYGTSRLYENITGTAYGKLYKVTSNTSQPYTESGTVTKTVDLTASIDHANKAIWFFSATGVKKLTTPDKPIAVVFTPRWALADNVNVTAYVVTASRVHVLSDTLTLDAGFAVPASLGAVYTAAADNAGNIFLACANGLALYDGTTTLAYSATDFKNINAVAVAYDNTIVLGDITGRIVSYTLNSVKALVQKAVLLDSPKDGTGATINIAAAYQFDLSTADYLFAIDQINRRLLSFDLIKNISKRVYLDKVPSNVVSDNAGAVYVTFFDAANGLKFANDLTGQTTVTTPVKAAGATFSSELVVTDLYTDANVVTSAESTTAQRINAYDQPVNTALTATFTFTGERPIFYTVLGGTATVNGTAFTSGYIWKGDVVVVAASGDSSYYGETQVDLVGNAPISVLFRTIAKTWPDSVVLDRQLEAFVNVEYTRQFTVSGITEGFTADLATDPTTLLTFAVNDGTFGKTGTVKNGDVVTVKSKVKNLVQQRTDYTIDTADKAHNAATWTILVMALNGVDRRQDSVATGERTALLRGAGLDSIDTPLVGDRQASTTIATQATTGGVHPARMSVSNDTFAPTQCPQRTTFTAFNDARVTRYSSTVDTDLTSVFQSQNYQIAVPYVGVERIQSNQLYWPMEFVFVVRNDMSIALEIKEWISNEAAHVYSIDAEYSQRFGVSSYATNADYGRYIGTTLYANDQKFDLNPARASIATALPGNVRPFNPFVANDLPGDRRDGLSSYSLAWEGLARLSNSHLGIAAVYDSRLQVTSWTAANVGDRGVQYHTLATDAVYARADFGVFYPVDFPGDVASGIHAASVAYADAVALRANTGVANTMQFAVATGVHSIDLPMPIASAPSYGDTFTVSPENGFLANQQDAINDAASVGLLDGVEYFAINGKWLYISKPTSEYAVCTITPKPPQKQRRFGYMGGG